MGTGYAAGRSRSIRRGQQSLHADRDALLAEQRELQAARDAFSEHQKTLQAHRQAQFEQLQAFIADRDSLVEEKKLFQAGRDTFAEEQRALQAAQEAFAETQHALNAVREGIADEQKALNADRQAFADEKRSFAAARETLEREQCALRAAQEALSAAQNSMQADRDAIAESQKCLQAGLESAAQEQCAWRSINKLSQRKSERWRPSGTRSRPSNADSRPIARRSGSNGKRGSSKKIASTSSGRTGGSNRKNYAAAKKPGWRPSRPRSCAGFNANKRNWIPPAHLRGTMRAERSRPGSSRIATRGRTRQLDDREKALAAQAASLASAVDQSKATTAEMAERSQSLDEQKLGLDAWAEQLRQSAADAANRTAELDRQAAELGRRAAELDTRLAELTNKAAKLRAAQFEPANWALSRRSKTTCKVKEPVSRRKSSNSKKSKAICNSNAKTCSASARSSEGAQPVLGRDAAPRTGAALRPRSETSPTPTATGGIRPPRRRRRTIPTSRRWTSKTFSAAWVTRSISTMVRPIPKRPRRPPRSRGNRSLRRKERWTRPAQRPRRPPRTTKNRSTRIWRSHQRVGVKQRDPSGGGAKTEHSAAPNRPVPRWPASETPTASQGDSKDSRPHAETEACAAGGGARKACRSIGTLRSGESLGRTRVGTARSQAIDHRDAFEIGRDVGSDCRRRRNVLALGAYGGGTLIVFAAGTSFLIAVYWGLQYALLTGRLIVNRTGGITLRRHRGNRHPADAQSAHRRKPRNCPIGR